MALPRGDGVRDRGGLHDGEMVKVSETRVGDRVRLWMGTEVRGAWEHGTVTGVDDKSVPGVSIAFDRRVNGIDTCYATHAEVEVIARVPDDFASRVADDEFAGRYRAQYEPRVIPPARP